MASMRWALLLGAALATLLADSCGASDTPQRFTNLDRLLSRLGATEAPAPTEPAPEHHMRRHWAAWLRKNHQQEEDNDQDEEEDDDEEDYEEEQADHNTFSTVRKENSGVANSISARITSDNVSYTAQKTQERKASRAFDFKWPNPRRNVEKSWTYRSTVKPSDTDNSAQNEVYRHNIRMSRETACRVPQLKVVRVSDHYPSTSKVYLPSCTRLHQCAEDTGCCGHAQKCGPKTTKMVELYFYTTYSVSPGRHHRNTPTIEKLPFYNHTECECQDRADEMPRDTEQNRFMDPIRNAGCRCPSEYTVRHLSNGSCACDCFDKQRDCTKYKKGKEYFNHQDRLCIETGSCTVPACDFGAYLRRSGRCPRKHEKFRSWARYN